MDRRTVLEGEMRGEPQVSGVREMFGGSLSDMMSHVFEGATLEEPVVGESVPVL